MIDFALAFKSHINNEIKDFFGNEYDQQIYSNFDYHTKKRRDFNLRKISYFTIEYIYIKFNISHNCINDNIIEYSIPMFYIFCNNNRLNKELNEEKDLFFSKLDARLNLIIKEINKGRVDFGCANTI